jgi:hypothetical protein
MIRRFAAYMNKVYGLGRALGELLDQRQGPRVSAESCALFAFWMFALGLPSFNAFEEKLRSEERRQLWRKLFHGRPASADTVGYCFERLDPEPLRRLLKRIYTTLQRNHLIARIAVRGFRVLAVDGHELFTSYRRHCPHCLTRTVQTRRGERLQYYHSLVMAQLVGGPIALPLDLELLRPGEAEITAAHRLLERVCQNYPKAFDLINGDGLYANPQALEIARRHRKHLLAVLKDNHPDLLEDAKALFAQHQPIRSCEGQTEFERWDLEGFTSWPQAGQTVRVIRSQETTRQANEIKTADWFWVTTLAQSLLPTEDLCGFGHQRWEIENQGFNYLVHYFHLDHPFHHHPTAITVLLLLAFIAYILLQAFYQLNLKPARRLHLALASLISELAISFFANPHPFPWNPLPRPP